MRHDVRLPGLPLLAALVMVLAAAEARAQQPTPDDMAEVGDFEVTGSTEIGVRGVKVDGSDDTYKSHVNYSPGFRVFDSSVLMESKDGDGVPFDRFLVTSSGWGGDPSGYVRVNAEKNTLYEFDAQVRRYNYFQRLTTIAFGEHAHDVKHNFGDFDLRLFPQNDVKVQLGYSYDRYHGPTETTLDFSRDEFTLEGDSRVRANNFRVGVEATLGSFDLSFLQGFRRFRDDSTYRIPGLEQGGPTVQTFLSQYEREEPTRGHHAFTRLGLHALFEKRVDVTARFIYVNGRSEFDTIETAVGQNYLGQPIDFQGFVSSGDAKRIQVVGDFGITVLATDRFRITDNVQFTRFAIDGGYEANTTLLTDVGEGPVTFFTNPLAFRSTRYRRVSNALELSYDFNTRFSGHIGWRFARRDVDLEGRDIPGEAEPDVENFDNTSNSVIVGFKARPVKRWTIYFDFDKGTTDSVFTRTAPYDFTNFRIRSRWHPTDTFSLNATVQTKDNTNPSRTDEIPPREFGANVNQRIYTVSADWNPYARFGLSGGYTRTHITSDTDIVAFVFFREFSGESRFFMRDNFAYLSATAQPHPRVQVYGAYRIHNDPGQGDRQTVLTPTPILIGSYPMQYQNAEAKVAVRLHQAADLNVGYQFYDFQEQFVNRQQYRAHLPYVSLRFYIGRRER
jgi:hypothetical protein